MCATMPWTTPSAWAVLIVDDTGFLQKRAFGRCPATALRYRRGRREPPGRRSPEVQNKVPGSQMDLMRGPLSVDVRSKYSLEIREGAAAEVNHRGTET